MFINTDMVWYGNACVQGQPLPDGESSVAADQIIYSSVGRGHAGTYTCTGDNGAGRVATDSVRVRVKCKKRDAEGTTLMFSYFSDAPVISVDHSYIHHTSNISLELVCSVEVRYHWSNFGLDKLLKNMST